MAKQHCLNASFKNSCCYSCGRTENINERFWAKVSKTNGCWIWTGFTDRAGYGMLKVTNPPKPPRRICAHRFSYELHYGPIKNGMSICHHCDNPTCVNPEHLFCGTPKDNSEDMVNKGRQGLGEKNPQHKLTEKQIRFIRSSKLARYELAKRFNVSWGAINLIVRKNTWKHVV